MADRAAAARAARGAKAEARSEARFRSVTKHFGAEGVGYSDGVWFLAESRLTVSALEESALRTGSDTEWSVQCLDAIGPLVGKQQLRPNIYIQIRAKYVQVWVDETNEVCAGVDDMLEVQLAEMGITLLKHIKLRSDVADIRRWA